MPSKGRLAVVILSLTTTLLLAACSDSGNDNPTQKSTIPQNVLSLAGDGQITLSWDEIPNASYNLYMDLTAGVGVDPRSSIQHMAHIDIPNPFIHSNLQNETSYYFVITSVIDGVESDISAEVSQKPFSLSAPQNVLATGKINEIELRWDESAGNNVSYNVYMGTTSGVDTNPDSSQNHLAELGIQSPYSYLTTNSEQVYYFTVTAVRDGVESAISTELSGQALPLNAPANVVTSAADSNVSLSWSNVSDPRVTYNLYMDTISGVGTNASATSQNFMIHTDVPNPFNHPQLQNGQSYYFVLTSELNGVQSVVSPEVMATPIAEVVAAPLAPANLTSGHVTSTQVPLTWVDTSNNEEGFSIERSERSPQGSIGTYTPIAQTAANIQQFNDTAATGLMPGKHYDYRISALNIIGSALSNSINVIVPPQDPNAFLLGLNKSAPRHQEDATTAQAYYDAIDPLKQKTTAAMWKSQNGFIENSSLSKDTPAVYLNNADLGFGRRMYVNPNTNGSGNVASYVENYPTLDDAIVGDPANLIATVAMEYTQPANDPVVAAAKKIVIARNHGKELTNSNDAYLTTGAYKLVVTRDFKNKAQLGNYQIVVTYADLSQETFSGQWTVPALDTYAVSFSEVNDPANPSHNFTITGDQMVHIEVLSEIGTNVLLIGSVGNVIAEDDNSGGGVNAKIVSPVLAAGWYTVVPTSAQKLALYTGANLKVTTSAGAVIYDRTAAVYPQLTNDPNIPRHYFLSRFRLLTPDSVTLELSKDPNSTSPDLDPYLYLVGAGGSGQNIDQVLEQLYAVTDSNQADVTLDLPAGDYVAVAATSYQGETDNFTLAATEVLANGTKGAAIPFNTPTPVFSWGSGSGGKSPFNLANPRFGFTVSPPAGQSTQKVNVNLAVDPLSTTFRSNPALYILGPAGEFRHVVARSTGQAAFPNESSYALIETVLNAGQYNAIIGTRGIGRNGDFSLRITDQSGASLLPTLPVQGSWLDSDGQNFTTANNPKYNFTVPADNTTVTIAVQTSFDLHPVIFLTNSAGVLINQNDQKSRTQSFIEADLLAGQYQFAVTTNYDNVPSNFTLDVTVDGVPQAQQSGSFVNTDRDNPYSPQSPRIPLTLDSNSRITAMLNSDVKVNLFLLGQGDQKITTFYTFIGNKGIELGGLNGVQAGDRVLSVDLDGRGEKYQPGVCNMCHGGYPKSLVAGIYPDNGDTGAGFLAWDLDLYKYKSAGQVYDRASQEPIFKNFNQTVLGIRRIPVMGSGPGHETTRNILIKGWYGGNELPNAQFDGSFVPKGWLPDSVTGLSQGIPDGAEQLYLQVIKPTCRLCHTQRDGVLFSTTPAYDTALAFGSYKHFMSYQNEIESTIYDKGVMPLALRTYNNFWNEGQADVLAQHLRRKGFSHDDDNGNVLLPGRPIAYAGPSVADIPSPTSGNRVVATNSLAKLNGKASIFANSYQWRFVSSIPAGINVTLTGPTTATPSFTPGADADYTFGLIVSNGSQNSAESFVTVTAASATTVPPVSFSANIKPFLNTATETYDPGPITYCISCHTRIEEYLSSSAEANNLNAHTMVQQSARHEFQMTGNSAELYSALRDRVNIDDPLQSMILEKAMGSDDKHGNQRLYGYGPFDAADTSFSWESYDIMLQWILDGAPDN